MNSLKRVLKYFFSTLIYTVISLLVTAAIILSLARIALPIVENYKTDIEVWISDLTGQQVEIATLDAVWYGMEPQLVLRGVQLLSADRMRVNSYFQDARFGLNLLASVVERRLVPGAFTLEGARFGVVRHEDGHISIQGIVTESNAENESDNFIESWLFQQRILDIKNSEIVWVDLKNNKTPKLFKDVNLRLINKDDRHLIRGSMELPRIFGSDINFIMDAKGDLLSADNWSGKSYFSINDLHINELIDAEFERKFYLNDGVVTANLWADWQAGHLISSRGLVGVGNLLLLSPAGQSIMIDHVKSNYSLLKKDSKWELALSNFVVNYENKLWPEGKANFRYDIESGDVSGKVDYLKLDDIVSVSSLLDSIDDNLAMKIQKLQIQGELNNINFNVFGGVISADGEINNFKNLAVEKIPGIDSLSGKFSLTNNSVELLLPKQNFTLSYPSAFKQDNKISDFSANLSFIKNDSSWDFSATDINAKLKKSVASGSLSLSSSPATASPLLDLAFYIRGGGLEDAGIYIPSTIMKESAVAWIEKSLQKGDVQSAVITHYGEVKQYPYLGNEGSFNVNIAVQNGSLTFAPEWPQINKINGLFRMDSKSFQFFANAGESIGNKLSKVIVNFPDFFASGHYLFINGEIQGDSKNKLNYLHQSPLERLFAKHIKPLKLEGESKVDLVLAIPLDKVKETVVSGNLNLVDNVVSAKEWKLDLTNVNTNLEFTEKNIAASLLTAKFFGTPVNCSIDTISANGIGQILIQGIGIFDVDIIGEALGYYIDKKVWANYLAGNTDILASLRIPFRLSDDRNERVTLQLSSNFKNLAINLPAPLHKESGDNSEFQLFTELTGQKRDVNIAYNNNFVLLQLQSTDTALVIEKGGIGFAQVAALPRERGIRFSGALPKFYWSEWESVLFPEVNVESLLTKGGSNTSIFFDVKLNDLEFFGKRFKDISIYASQTAQNWSLNFSGESLLGNVTIPIVYNNFFLVADFEKLYVTEEIKLNDKKELDPLTLPKLNLSIKDFKFKDMELGQLSLSTDKTDVGQKIEDFSLSSPAAKITASGEWKKADGNLQQSSFDLQIDASNLGSLLDAWSYKEVVKGGKGKINANIKWPGAPANFAINSLTGTARIDVKDASLLDFDLGAAKLFSVLLPRRLLLDFRDVIQKGMYFDTIKGDYKLENGNAFSDRLQLHGPVVDMELAGKIGISSKTFDQVVTVNRRIVGDSLPLMGFVTVAPALAPVVGGGIFIMKKLFEKQIDDILSVQYTLEGSWGAPVITPVKKNSPEPKESVDSLFD